MTDNNTRIVCLGDSITDGFVWPELVRASLKKAGKPIPRLYGAGIGGDTAKGMRARLDRDVLVHKPTLITVSAGINDIMRGVPVADYRSDMDAILARMKKENVDVIVMTTTVVGKGKEKQDKALAGYNAVLKELATKYGFRIAEVNEEMKKARANGDQLLEADHIHPSMAGYRVMAKAVLASMGHGDVPVVEQITPDLLPGVIGKWEILPITDKKWKLTDKTLAALPQTGWKEIQVPMLDPNDQNWWAKLESRRGMVMYLDKQCGKAKSYVGKTIIDSAAKKNCVLNTGGHLQVAYLNGKRIFQSSGWTGFHPGKERISINLNKGKNTLIIQTGPQFFTSITNSADWCN